MDRVYMTFLSKIDVQTPSMLNILRKKGLIATPTDFVKYLYGNYSYLIASEPLYKKQFLTTFDKSISFLYSSFKALAIVIIFKAIYFPSCLIFNITAII